MKRTEAGMRSPIDGDRLRLPEESSDRDGESHSRRHAIASRTLRAGGQTRRRALLEFRIRMDIF